MAYGGDALYADLVKACVMGFCLYTGAVLCGALCWQSAWIDTQRLVVKTRKNSDKPSSTTLTSILATPIIHAASVSPPL